MDDEDKKKLIRKLLDITSVSSDRWSYVADDWYIDTSSIEKRDEIMFVWQMINSPGVHESTQTPVLSTSLLYEYNCNDGTCTAHGIEMYTKEMCEGELIDKYKLQGEVVDVPSNPTAQLLYKKSCSYYQNRHDSVDDKYDLIDKIFDNQEELARFFERRRIVQTWNSDQTCTASLEKKESHWVYLLESHKKYIGEKIKPFEPSLENLNKFNNGCKELAKLLELYIDANDKSVLPLDAKPFGDLTF